MEITRQVEAILSRWNNNNSNEQQQSTAAAAAAAAAPTATDLYRIGRLLHVLQQKQQQQLLQPQQQQQAITLALSNVRTAYHETLQSLPASYRAWLFTTLKQGLLAVLTKTDTSQQQQQEALEAVAQLYQSSPELASEATTWSMADLKTLRSVHDGLLLVRATTNNSNSSTFSTTTTPLLLLLSILSHWLLTKPNVEWEDWLPAIHFVQQEVEEANDAAAAAASPPLWDDLVEWKSDHNPGWKSAVLERYPDHHDYLLSLLNVTTDDSAMLFLPQRRNDTTNNNAATKTEISRSSLTTTTEDELQRRIDQVCQVLPDLGQGFVELCLSYYKGDVEQTVAALLVQDGGLLPLALRHLDPTLPRTIMRKQHAGACTLGEEYNREQQQKDDESSRLAAAKATLVAMQRQEEQEAYLVDMVMRQGAHDEYNDDYDDQYDDTEGRGGGGGGGAAAANDAGLYYDDYTAVQTYNKVLKQVEDDQQFWQDNRNMNRSQQQPVKKTKNNNANEKSYRGPDKMKGGRVPRDAAGGGGGGGRGGGRSGGGRGGGKGRGGGRGSRGGRGGQGRGPNNNNNNDQQGSASASDNKKPGKSRAKQRQMENRRDRQKKAAAKRTG